MKNSMHNETKGPPEAVKKSVVVSLPRRGIEIEFFRSFPRPRSGCAENKELAVAPSPPWRDEAWRLDKLPRGRGRGQCVHPMRAAWAGGRRCVVLLCFSVLTSLSLSAEQHKPIRLHPENPHYFLFRGKPTVLITSAEHYGAVLNPDFDYITYLNVLQADGLNLTRTVNGNYLESK